MATGKARTAVTLRWLLRELGANCSGSPLVLTLKSQVPGNPSMSGKTQMMGCLARSSDDPKVAGNCPNNAGVLSAVCIALKCHFPHTVRVWHFPERNKAWAHSLNHGLSIVTYLLHSNYLSGTCYVFLGDIILGARDLMMKKINKDRHPRILLSWDVWFNEGDDDKC